MPHPSVTAETLPHKPAIIMGGSGEIVTYRELDERSNQGAQLLRSLGLEKGDHIALMLENCRQFLEICFACQRSGIIYTPVSTHLKADETRYILENCGARLFITSPRMHDVAGKMLAGAGAVRHFYMVGGIAEGFESWEEAVDLQPAERIGDEACGVDMLYSSGTTGKPKGAQLTHRGCVTNLLNVAFVNSVQPAALALARGESPGSQPPPAAPSALIATPLFHVTANNCVAHAVTLAGGKMVHMYKWDPQEALRLIEAEKITAFTAVPMMAREIMMHPDFATRDTSSLQSIGGGGAAMQPDLVAKVGENMGGARPNTGYGMTETCGIIAAVSAEFFVDRPTSVGRALPTLEARCVDPAGEPLPTGDIGELVVRGAPVIKGYLNRPDATAETIVDGWLHTGDIAYMDEDGFIYLVDRAKDMVLRGGENVYCAEVENALFHHPAVAECVAFAVPDERLGEEVGAAVYLAPGEHVDAAALREHCKEHVAPFKVPRYLWFVDQPLPRNANGKFVKRDLREKLRVENAS